MTTQFCPQCGTARLGQFRFCRTCQFDFDSERDIEAASAALAPAAMGDPAPSDTSPTAAWSSFSAPSAAPASPMPPAMPTETVVAARPSSRMSGRRVAVVAVVALIAIGGIGSALGSPSGTAAPSPRPSSGGVAVLPSTTPSPTPQPATPTPGLTPEPTPDPTPEPTPEPTIKPVSYTKLSSRAWSKLIKAPDDYLGRGYYVWACITQFDAATGTDTFRGDASYKKLEYWSLYGENSFFLGTESQLEDFVTDDIVYMKVTSLGSYTYDTSIGGSLTVPMFSVDSISRKGSCE